MPLFSSQRVGFFSFLLSSALLSTLAFADPPSLQIRDTKNKTTKTEQPPPPASRPTLLLKLTPPTSRPASPKREEIKLPPAPPPRPIEILDLLKQPASRPAPQPPLQRDTPPLQRDTPPLQRDTPPLQRDTPPLQRDTPPLQRDALPPDLMKRDDSPLAHAILLNGGGSPRINFYSHTLYLRMMRMILQERGVHDDLITIFSSDGDAPEADQAIKPTEKDRIGWLFKGRREARFFRQRPKLIDTVIKGKKLHPAKKKALGVVLPQIAKQLSPKDKRPLLLFVTDHGTKNPKTRHDRDHRISLWHENLSVRELHRRLRVFGKRRVVSIMSQCYSGSFLWSVFRKPGNFSIPLGDRCGFYSTTPSRVAYGCFPELQLKKHVGHAYRFILAMRGARTMDEAHQQTLLSDVTPDVPHRSSDGFLYAMLRADADAEGIALEKLADELLQRYNNKEYPGIEEDRNLIGKIAQRFQLARPLDFAGLQTQKTALKKRLAWWKRVRSMWSDAFATARDHHLNALYKADPKLQKLAKDAFDASLRRPTPRKPSSRRPLLRPSSPRSAAPPLAPRQRRYQRPTTQPRERIADELRKKGFLSFLKRIQKKSPQEEKSDENAEEKAKQFLLSFAERILGKRFLTYGLMRPELFSRLRRLYKREEAMKQAIFRQEVQLAALARIEMLLYRIAARLQLQYSDHPDHQAYRKGFENLTTCEKTPLTQEEETPPSPKLDAWSLGEDKLPLPAWFGVAFQPVPSGKWGFPSGAVRVQEVYLDTPAAQAGLQEGDIITTLNYKELREPFEIRERVMLSPTDRDSSIFVLRKGNLKRLSIRFRRLLEPPSMKTQPLIGRIAPPLHTLQKLSTGNLPTKASTTLLFFWATWCGPCKAALPALRELQDRYREQGLQIVTISREEEAIVRRWLTQNPEKMPFLNTLDPDSKLGSPLRIRAFPTLVLLHKGQIQGYYVGFGVSTRKELEEALQSLLAPRKGLLHPAPPRPKQR